MYEARRNSHNLERNIQHPRLNVRNAFWGDSMDALGN